MLGKFRTLITVSQSNFTYELQIIYTSINLIYLNITVPITRSVEGDIYPVDFN